MATEETKIQFSADGLDHIRTDASGFMNELIEDAKQYNLTGNETLKFLKEEIELLERRNRIESRFERQDLQRKRVIGEISNPEYETELGKVRIGEYRGDTQVEILREMLSQLKLLNATDFETESKRLLDLLGETGENKGLSELLDKLREEREVSQQKGGTTAQQTPESEMQRFLSRVDWKSFALANLLRPISETDPLRMATSTGSNVGSAMMMAGGKLGPWGLLVSLLSEAIGLGIDKVDQIQQAEVTNVQLFGGRREDYTNFFRGSVDYERLRNEQNFTSKDLLNESINRRDLETVDRNQDNISGVVQKGAEESKKATETQVNQEGNWFTDLKKLVVPLILGGPMALPGLILRRRSENAEAQAIKEGEKTSSSEYTPFNYLKNLILPSNGILGLGESDIIKKAQQQISQPVTSEGSTGTNRTLGDTTQSISENLGFSGLDILRERAKLSLSKGSQASLSETLVSLGYQRGFGLSDQQVGGMQRTLRGNDQSLQQVLRQVTGDMRTSGMARGNDFSLLGENLQLLVSISQKQLEELGEVNVGVNSKMMQAFATLDTSLKNPDVLRNVFQKIYDGLQQQRTPQMEALAYQALSQVNPQATVYQLQMMKEQPFAEQNQQYLPNLMKIIQQVSGNNAEMFAENFSQFFNTSKTMAAKITGAYANNEDWLGAFRENYQKGVSTEEVFERAEESTTSKQEREATTTDFQNNVVEKVVDLKGAVDNIYNAITGRGRYNYTPTPLPVTNNTKDNSKR